MNEIKIEYLVDDGDNPFEHWELWSKVPKRRERCPHCNWFYCRHHLAKIICNEGKCRKIKWNKVITREDLLKYKHLYHILIYHIFLNNFNIQNSL